MKIKFIYNSSIVEESVSNYCNYLNGNGVFINEVCLISKNELKKIGCVAGKYIKCLVCI